MAFDALFYDNLWMTTSKTAASIV